MLVCVEDQTLLSKAQTTLAGTDGLRACGKPGWDRLSGEE